MKPQSKWLSSKKKYIYGSAVQDDSNWEQDPLLNHVYSYIWTMKTNQIVGKPNDLHCSVSEHFNVFMDTISKLNKILWIKEYKKKNHKFTWFQDNILSMCSLFFRLPEPGKIFMTPLGMPAFTASSANLSAVSGVTCKDTQCKTLNVTIRIFPLKVAEFAALFISFHWRRVKKVNEWMSVCLLNSPALV